MSTRNTAARIRGVSRCAKNQNRTRTRGTHFKSTAGLPAPILNPNHGHSISGYAMMLGNRCFSWSSKKQTATALSTGEAEYHATIHAGREVNWVQQLLAEIGFSPE